VETTVVTTFAGVAEGVGLNDCEVVVAAAPVALGVGRRDWAAVLVLGTRLPGVVGVSLSRAGELLVGVGGLDLPPTVVVGGGVAP